MSCAHPCLDAKPVLLASVDVAVVVAHRVPKKDRPHNAWGTECLRIECQMLMPDAEGLTPRIYKINRKHE